MPVGTIAKRRFANELGRDIKVGVMSRPNTDFFPGEVGIAIESADSLDELFCTRMEAEQLRDALVEFLG